LIFGREANPGPSYDDTLHELHAVTRELERNVNDLHQVVQPFLDTTNPLIAMVVTLLNEQQMRPRPEDAEPNS
jgi:hypothetical protein